MAKLTDPIFKTGAKDEVLAQDVYAVKDSVVKNKLTSKLEGMLSSALGGKLGGLGNTLLSAKGKLDAVRAKVKAVANSPAIKKLKAGIDTAKEKLNQVRKQVGNAKAKLDQAKRAVNTAKGLVNGVKANVNAFKGNVKNFGKDFKTAQKNFLGDVKQGSLDRLGGVLNLKKISPTDLGSSITDSFTQSKRLLTQTVDFDIGGKKSSKSGDSAGAMATASAINSYTGKKDGVKATDREAEMAFATALAREAVAAGMGDAFEDIISKAEEGGDVTEVLLDSFDELALQSHMSGMKFVLTKITGSVIRRKYPTAIVMVLENYSLPGNKGMSAIPKELETLNTVLDGIDPFWYKIMRGEKETLDLRPFQKASPDAIAVLAHDDRFEDALSVAHDFDEKDLKEAAKQNYPWANLTTIT